MPDATDESAPGDPTRPSRLGVRYERFGDAVEVSRRSGGGAAGGCFLVLWLIGWTIGCVFLTVQAIREPKLFHILFGIPSWASWLFVFGLILKMFFQRDALRLDRDGASFVRRVIVPVTHRNVPLHEIKRFAACGAASAGNAGGAGHAIELRTIGQPLRMFDGLAPDQAAWLAHELNGHLHASKGPLDGPVGDEQLDGATAESEPAEADRPAGRSGDATVLAADDAPAGRGAKPRGRRRVVLQPAEQPIAPPSDTRRRRVDDFDAFEIVQRGRLSFSALGGLLLINAFWNGIVSVFIATLFLPEMNGPKGVDWWGLFIFLIPFEVIGLAMFLGLLFVVAEPFRKSSWRFGRQEIERRTTWLGFGPRQTWWIERLDRLELRERDGKIHRLLAARGMSGGEPRRRWAATANDSTPPAAGQGLAETLQSLSAQVREVSAAAGADTVDLVFVERGNVELLKINALTEGEARWIADMVMRERPGWFR